MLVPCERRSNLAAQSLEWNHSWVNWRALVVSQFGRRTRCRVMFRLWKIMSAVSLSSLRQSGRFASAGHPARPRHLRPAAGKAFMFGVAYYPEHWPRRQWPRDFALMKRHGVNTVRMGEFAWDVWEPCEGEYDFELFDHVIALAAQHDIKVVLGTPTAGPPRWLSADHPDWLKRTREGLLVDHTGRLHGSPMSEGFRMASTRLVAALAEHYANHPTVVGWQIDNEFHCVCPFDFSDQAQGAFQAWLRERYRRIDLLNRRWGTSFSAQTYASFDQVPLPLRSRPDHFPPHPGHLLDFHRFTSDATVRFCDDQVALLRQANPDWMIFHNGLFAHLDYWKLAEKLTCLGVDLYPGFGGEGLAERAWNAFKLEQCRAHSGSFIVPELASGAAGSRQHLLETPPPGQMRLWAWQCVAHGADGIFHFRWRTARFGQEVYWRGVLDHDGGEGRRLEELGVEGAEFGRIGPKLIGTVRVVEIGVLIDRDQDDNQEAILPVHYPAPRHQAEHLLGALLERHLPAGLVHVQDRWDGLDVLIIPSFADVGKELANRLTAFVKGGGTVVATAGTGSRDHNVQAVGVRAPGTLANLFGAEVEEVGAFVRSPVIAMVPTDTDRVLVEIGYEILKPRKARSVARWAMREGEDGRQPHAAADRTAATLHSHGAGRALLLGMWISRGSARPLVAWLSALLGWQAVVQAPPEVTVVRRRSDRRSMLFLLNHSPYRQVVEGLDGGRNLITNRRVGSRCELPAYGVAVVQER